MNGVDDLGVVDPAQVHRRDPEIGMPELPLYDQQRDTLAGHLDGVSVSQLVLVPMSAQPPICRPRRNADASDGRSAWHGFRDNEVGITPTPRGHGFLLARAGRLMWMYRLVARAG